MGAVSVVGVVSAVGVVGACCMLADRESLGGLVWATRPGERARWGSCNRFAEAGTCPVCSTGPQRTDVRGKPGLVRGLGPIV